MTTTKHGWDIHNAEAAVLTYTYNFAPGAEANAFAARMNDGRMLVISPPTGASEGVFEDIASFGEVGAIVANNGLHHMGLAAWKERFPDAACCAAPEAIQRIAKKNKSAPPLAPIETIRPLLGDHITITVSPHLKLGELWAQAATDAGHIWYGSDVISNLASYPPNFVLRTFFKWTGTKLGLGVFHTAMKLTARDKKKALAELKAEMAEKAPATIVPGHGAAVTSSDLAERAEAFLRA